MVKKLWYKFKQQKELMSVLNYAHLTLTVKQRKVMSAQNKMSPGCHKCLTKEGHSISTSTSLIEMIQLFFCLKSSQYISYIKRVHVRSQVQPLVTSVCGSHPSLKFPTLPSATCKC